MEAEAVHVEHAWTPSRHILRTVQAVIDDPSLDIVLLEAFGCLFDATSIPYAHRMLREAHRPYAMIKIDDLTDTAHVRIRLRTLAESIEQVRLASASQQKPVRTEALPSAAIEALPPMLDPDVRIASHDLHTRYAAAARLGNLAAFASIEDDDLVVARAFNRDLCLVAGAIIGRAVRLAAQCPTLGRLAVPKTCRDCLLDSLPDVLEQAVGRCPDIEWVEDYPAPMPPEEKAESARIDTYAAALSAQRPKVGIVGAAPLVFDPFLNDSLGAFIERQGFQPIWPELGNLMTDNVRYYDQLDAFHAQGVATVTYVQSFGRLKGHIMSRGNARAFAERYPDMPILVLDYDREASALNRENRLRLALSAIREKLER